MSAIGLSCGIPADLDLLFHSWKTLMQNHPHDSICGCSVDPVHQEMEVRFTSATDCADALSDEVMMKIAKQIPINEDVNLVVFHTALVSAVRMVKATVELDAAKGMPKHISMVDAIGQKVPCTVEKNRSLPQL